MQSTLLKLYVYMYVCIQHSIKSVYHQCCPDEPMHVQVNASSSVVDAAVMGLQLDELELASLRGEVQEVSLNLNFDTRVGRGKVNVAGPRFSGLQGEALSGGVRWERDVIRLEKAVLQQRTSRYDLLLYLVALTVLGVI